MLYSQAIHYSLGHSESQIGNAAHCDRGVTHATNNVGTWRVTSKCRVYIQKDDHLCDAWEGGYLVRHADRPSSCPELSSVHTHTHETVLLQVQYGCAGVLMRE